jgi:zinc transporter ZupT
MARTVSARKRAQCVAIGPKVARAFGMVIGAGLATGIGASVVFSKSLMVLANMRILAGCLGLAAGELLYLSFVEILPKSVEAYHAGGEGALEEKEAYLYATLTYFLGFLFVRLLDGLVHYLDQSHSHRDGIMETTNHGSPGSPIQGLGTPVQCKDVESAIGDVESAQTATRTGTGNSMDPQHSRLRSMGIMTALAITIHQAPAITIPGAVVRVARVYARISTQHSVKLTFILRSCHFHRCS